VSRENLANARWNQHASKEHNEKDESGAKTRCFQWKHGRRILSSVLENQFEERTSRSSL